jgi:hypothetical protein
MARSSTIGPPEVLPADAVMNMKVPAHRGQMPDGRHTARRPPRQKYDRNPLRAQSAVLGNRKTPEVEGGWRTVSRGAGRGRGLRTVRVLSLASVTRLSNVPALQHVMSPPIGTLIEHPLPTCLCRPVWLHLLAVPPSAPPEPSRLAAPSPGRHVGTENGTTDGGLGRYPPQPRLCDFATFATGEKSSRSPVAVVPEPDATDFCR